MNRYQRVNLFVKNLEPDIDTSRLFKEFSHFGTIKSVKVMKEGGLSKGYGFVCFSSPEEATKAVTEMNGRTLGSKSLYVALAQNKEDRKVTLASQRTNLYVKNLDIQIDDERLRKEFSRFGTITSAKVMTEDGISKGFGFVCFSTSAEAMEAIDGMDGRIIESKKIYVALSQRKEDRRALLTAQCCNLYVKNLDANIDDERLFNEFSQFGTITSAKVMLENGRSKAFGFVCFSSPEEAFKAIDEMHGRTVESKLLYVALAQRKEDRQAHLATQYWQRIASMRMQNQHLGWIGQMSQNQQLGWMDQMFQPSSAGYFVPPIPPGQANMVPPLNTQTQQMNVAPQCQNPIRPSNGGTNFKTLPPQTTWSAFQSAIRAVTSKMEQTQTSQSTRLRLPVPYSQLGHQPPHATQIQGPPRFSMELPLRTR